MNFLRSFVLFSRPHTVVGTTLSLTTLYLLAAAFTDASLPRLADFGWAWLSCFGANIYIVGLNQLTDIEIDRINKPYLPLASGAFSPALGRALILGALFLSLLIAFHYGGYLQWTVLLSLLLGTMYSLPPFRLKRFHFWAAFCIIAVRGLIVNFLLFLHFHQLINGRTDLPVEIWLLAAFFFCFSIIIAWFKDVPDMEGDRSHRIQTLSIRLGARRVFFIGNALLSVSFLGVIAVALSVPLAVSAGWLVLGNVAFFCLLWLYNARILAQANAPFQHVRDWFPRYYQFIWLLFFGEYLVFALAGA